MAMTLKRYGLPYIETTCGVCKSVRYNRYTLGVICSGPAITEMSME